MDLDELTNNADYETNAKRVKNRHSLLKILSDSFLQHELSYWTIKFRGSNIPSGPVNNVAEAFEHEQVKHLGLVKELEHPVYGRVKTVGSSSPTILEYSLFRQYDNI